ncbi:NAD-dependent epimerase/dehydratase family protein [Arcticibacterium luteifluviistationis]|uniref:NAD-dependent epimerase n=1 Tax=Arcticibacterium luteifluviistationis TaxID=1784714 RepID=A0A2Z4GGN7_9BACT|nr:NAD-dependent epimerase/dehydratase family protein [Arcticibacterium luteifluviistationis]AWV99963.1 NAD-dependent epimerase [Arcticibacterium luteifluviistationis]
MKTTKILIVGANGQLGTVMTEALQQRFGLANVISSDLVNKEQHQGAFETLDATNYDQLQQITVNHGITQIYHLAAILSASGENNPLYTWEVNMKALLNVLEVARKYNMDRVFYPSSIAVFGPAVNKEFTSQDSYLNPTTVYGISKAAGENWCQYYFKRYGLDVRSLRYPGVVGYQSMPGGGTTDYAVDIFHKAIASETYHCFLKPDTRLPMIFMEDAIEATLQLMSTPKSNIKIRTSYNLSGLSFSPLELSREIKKHIPDFKIVYEPDFRQNIAESWPRKINDKDARMDWGWMPSYSLESLTETMLSKLSQKLKPVS